MWEGKGKNNDKYEQEFLIQFEGKKNTCYKVVKNKTFYFVIMGPNQFKLGSKVFWIKISLMSY